MSDSFIAPNHWKHTNEELRKWFQQSSESSISSVISPAMICVISGAQGIGKTTFITKFALEEGLSIHWITPEKCDSSKEFLLQLNKYIYPSVDTTFNGIDARRVCICIDNWDILMTNDRNMFSTLFQFLTSNRANPNGRRIVCICERSVDKKFQEIQPPLKIISMKPMNDTDICFILKKKFPSLHLSLITQISDSCNNNLNRALEMAQFESSSGAVAVSATSAIPPSELYKINVLSQTDVLPALSQLYVPKSPNEWQQLFLQDPWMYPLRFHENLLKELEQRESIKSLKIKTYDQCLSAFIQWDQWMTRTIKDDESTWVTISILIWSLSVYIYLDAYKRIKKQKYSEASMVEFTKLLSQLSLQKKNSQNTFQTFRGSHYPIYEFPNHWFSEV